MVTAQRNKRQPGMFGPFNGMTVCPRAENIQKAKDGELAISFPWLSSHNLTTQSSECHPVSGSSHKLSLFNILHENKSMMEKEVVRRTTIVKELKIRINRQIDEHIHASYNHDTRFLNQMKPINHIFLFRSLIDTKNCMKNDDIQKRINEVTAHIITAN